MTAWSAEQGLHGRRESLRFHVGLHGITQDIASGLAPGDGAAKVFM